MIRLLLSLVVLTAIALGLTFVAELDGGVAVTLMGTKFETSLAVAFVAIVLFAIAFSLIWAVLRFVFRLPSLISIGWSARRRHKGHLAVSRGMIAVGAGDQKIARRSASEAQRLLGKEPLALLLSAQAAQMEGDASAASRAFRDMLDSPDTKLLGLRGLFMEAQRAGHAQDAFRYAEETATIAPATAWAAEALMEHHAKAGNWHKALSTLERSNSAFERSERKRLRAVLLTGAALAYGDCSPEETMEAAREASKLAPELVPAQVIYARALSRQGDFRKASRILEAAWKLEPHPEIGEAYLLVRPGDAGRERLARAKKLFSIHSDHPESRFVMGQALIATRDFDAARKILAPLIEDMPTVRVCLLMAELAEVEDGDAGHVREWLARASHATRDSIWIADGVMTDVWKPLSPITGKLDAFVWSKPAEALADRRVSQVLDGALKHLSAGGSQISADTTSQPVQSGVKKTLSASAFLASQTQTPTAPAPARKKSADVVFPLAHSPDDPGPDGAV
jgi:HemY protein